MTSLEIELLDACKDALSFISIVWDDISENTGATHYLVDKLRDVIAKAEKTP